MIYSRKLYNIYLVERNKTTIHVTTESQCCVVRLFLLSPMKIVQSLQRKISLAEWLYMNRGMNTKYVHSLMLGNY